MSRAIYPPLDGRERQAFIATARAHERAQTPFRHQGRSERGVDCGGLIALSLIAAGRVPADPTGYTRRPYRDSLKNTLVSNFGDPVAADKLEEGDVVLMAFGGEPCHVGIVTEHLDGGWALLHAYAPHRRVVEHSLDGRWLNSIREVFRP